MGALAPLLLAGCAQVGPPRPPSANLPAAASGFTARRLGADLDLRWTGPGETRDGVGQRGRITPWLCIWPGGGVAPPPAYVPCPRRLRLGPATPPGRAGQARLPLGALTLALPGVPPLPATSPRNLQVALVFANASGHWGARTPFRLVPTTPVAPPPVWLPAQVDRAGIQLRWRAAAPSRVRLERRNLRALVTAAMPPPAPAPHGSAPARWRAVADVLSGVTQYHDRRITWGRVYAYRLVSLAGYGSEEVTSAPSPVLTVPARDVFPPAAPAGLESVVTPPSQPGASYQVALSWLPVRPSPPVSVAGYNVYRRRGPRAAWRRRNPALLLTSVYSDSVAASAGARFQYAVTAVGENGVEGPKSVPVTAVLPEPGG
ncbi:MAG: hypothetical protein ACRD2E_13580 [Terriglobales bacterium]